jgi:hypothetical protein
LAAAGWAVCALAYGLRVRRARRLGPEDELEARRSSHTLRHLEAVSLAAALGVGLVLMSLHGWRLGFPRWLSTKLGLVAFLLVPLEAFRVYISLGWLGPGLSQTTAPPFSKDLARAVSMDDMLEALAVPLLVLALPVILWLSWARPF